MLESRFKGTDALGDEVVETVVVKLVAELAPILGTGKLLRRPFSTPPDDQRLDECRFLKIHAGTVRSAALILMTLMLRRNLRVW